MARATEWRSSSGSGLLFEPNRWVQLGIASLFPGETLTRTVWWWKFWSLSDGWSERFYFAHAAAALAAVPISAFPPPTGPLSAPDNPWIWNEYFTADPHPDTNTAAGPVYGEFKIDTDVNHRNNSGEEEVLGFFAEEPASWDNSTIPDRVTFAARFLIMAPPPAFQPVTTNADSIWHKYSRQV